MCPTERERSRPARCFGKHRKPGERDTEGVCGALLVLEVYTYIYIYIYIYEYMYIQREREICGGERCGALTELEIHIYIYVYIYIQRERSREMARGER